ncbi:MAG TPA: SRPBCC domain-containing protein [Actinomycetota bacterium]|jgi:uncharacterized protein YndB with AHSA1/START domain|nr:SRPBCC domain-containing protein [Actinomycetota bacterium]
MPTGLTTHVQVMIDAPAPAVWRALTEPDLIRRWFFGVETETDWSVGGPIVHRGEYQGRPYEDKGTIVRFEPERLLVHSHWSPVSGLPDEPGRYQEVTWSLTGRDGATELTVSEVNLPSEAARDVSEQSWRAALGALKTLLEGEG